jgi:hypothetical protein
LTEALEYVFTRDLLALRPAWDALVAGVLLPSFYHRWQWNRAVSDLLFQGDIGYHCFFDHERLVAAFPMSGAVHVRRAPFVRMLQAPSHPEIFVGDALVEEAYVTRAGPLLARFALAVAPRPDFLRFLRVPSRSCLERGLEPGEGVVRHIDGGSAYCDCTSVESLSHLSSKHRQNVNRLSRRAEREIGPVQRLTFAGQSAADAGLAHFARVEAASWKGPAGEGTSLSCRPAALEFYKGVLAGFGETDDARVDLLCIGGTPAAAQLAVRSASTWSLLKVGFDDSFSAFGPGNILLSIFIQEMAETADVSTVSLTTAPEWSTRWHMHVDPTFRITVLCRTPRARALSLDKRVRTLTRRLLRRQGGAAEGDER